MIEGPRDRPWLTAEADWKSVVEACYSARSQDALLYAVNLPPAFFHLSSRLAGEYLQKWRQYRVRVGVVCPATVTFSTRFGEMLAEEAGRGYFRIFGTRDDAVAWLKDVGEEAGGG